MLGERLPKRRDLIHQLLVLFFQLAFWFGQLIDRLEHLRRVPGICGRRSRGYLRAGGASVKRRKRHAHAEIQDRDPDSPGHDDLLENTTTRRLPIYKTGAAAGSY